MVLIQSNTDEPSVGETRSDPSLLQTIKNHTMHHQITFIGIDNWNRPIYRVIGKKRYYGSTDTLFSHEADAKEVNEYFKDNLSELEYFGTRFGCEPKGGRPGNLILTII